MKTDPRWSRDNFYWPLSVDGSRSVPRPCPPSSSGWPMVCKPRWCCSSYSLTMDTTVLFKIHWTQGTSACVTDKTTAGGGGFERLTQKHGILHFAVIIKACSLWQNDTLRQQIFTLDAVVFHQLCTVYQHLRGDVIYSLTLENTCKVQSAESLVLEAFMSFAIHFWRAAPDNCFWGSF